MTAILQYVKAESLEQARQILLSNDRNAILGGYAFLRLGSRTINTAIDLSGLGLQYIRETEGTIEIGAMTTLSEIENSLPLQRCFSGILPLAARKIAGVQVRNQATIGGTVAGHYGFSDLLCALMAMGAEVLLYDTGLVPLEEYLQRKAGKEIVERISIPKVNAAGAFQAIRNSTGDFALLNVAVSYSEKGWRIVVGARPAVAKLARTASGFLNGQAVVGSPEIFRASAMATAECSFGATMKTGAAYRKNVCPVLVKRAIEEVISCR